MVTARERSKSVGRATPRSPGRTPSRSQSRPRARPSSKNRRTPASDTKVRRRRSPSPSSSSSEGSYRRRSVSQGRTKNATEQKPDRSSSSNQANSTRSSRKSVQKTQSNRHHSSVIIRSLSPSPRASKSPCCYVMTCEKISTLFRETICPSRVLALLMLVSLLPTVLWLNLWTFLPTSSATDAKVPVQTIWGPAYRFAGVLWPTDWRIYFDYRCHLFVLSYLLLHFLFARFIPFTHRWGSNNDTRRSDYKANGLFALVAFGAVFAVAQFGHFPQLHLVKPSLLFPKYWLSLLAATGEIGVLATLLVHFVCRRLPRSQCSPEGNTGSFIVDLWVGRALRPRWLGLDWKMVILRPGTIGLLLAEITCLCVQWERYGRISPALATMVALHTIWIVDFLAFEHTNATSFEVRHEGFGYCIIVGTLMIPFCCSLGAAYMLAKPDLGNLFTANGSPIYAQWTLFILSVVLFLLGFWIHRVASNQKDRFRCQPNHPTFAEMPKISGPHTQRLLAGGWWGFVRHPNYLGTIMMAHAAALVSGFASFIPWIYPVFLKLALIHRIWRTEYLNEEKYGSSWLMYTKLVPHKLVPGIY